MMSTEANGERTERLAGEALSRLAYGLETKESEIRVLLRRNALVAVAMAWGQHRARADAERDQVARMIEEAAELDRARLAATADGPYPISLQQSVERARAEMANVLRCADSDLIGLELALDHVGKLLRFDPDAARRLVAVTRWRSATIDDTEVESRRRLTADFLLLLAQKMEM